MRLAIRTSICYFPLALVYKLFAEPIVQPAANYWSNAYWWVTSLWLMLVFIDIRKHCIDNAYRLIALVIAIYWGSMILLRTYIFFDIDMYGRLISSAGKLTAGAVVIVLSLIFLTTKVLWFKRSKTD